MPQNYDFGKNWNEVLKHLTFPETENIIKKAYNGCKYGDDWLKGSYNMRDYDKNISPTMLLGPTTRLAEILNNMSQNEIDNKKSEHISIKDRKFINNQRYLSLDQFHDSYNQSEIFAIEDRILKSLGYDWEFNKDKIIQYLPITSSHIWHSTFSIQLAKTMFPNDKWKLLRGNKYTTVYCKEKDTIFDIIQWSFDNRLEDYMNNIPYKSKDLTLGGNEAYKNATEN